MREDYLKGNNESLSGEERELEKALRPLSFDDFTGQQKIVDNIKIFVLAAKQRGESLDHVLLHGPPGLGRRRPGRLSVPPSRRRRRRARPR